MSKNCYIERPLCPGNLTAGLPAGSGLPDRTKYPACRVGPSDYTDILSEAFQRYPF
jgi:hypothetical protein